MATPRTDHSANFSITEKAGLYMKANGLNFSTAGATASWASATLAINTNEATENNLDNLFILLLPSSHLEDLLTPATNRDKFYLYAYEALEPPQVLLGVSW